MAPLADAMRLIDDEARDGKRATSASVMRGLINRSGDM